MGGLNRASFLHLTDARLLGSFLAARQRCAGRPGAAHRARRPAGPQVSELSCSRSLRFLGGQPPFCCAFLREKQRLDRRFAVERAMDGAGRGTGSVLLCSDLV